ncbi:hypothetical protein BV898_14672 [Hypsibius exemplaris]|uniref:Uncharacterized protein n=1 Tax=Hypsibius exemplaris TaxID=2072580 RepID=A0A9X6N981_HYPEX|nr:hypothetical protein BV898_14672 [Hypsibius exemplaris]
MVILLEVFLVTLLWSCICDYGSTMELTLSSVNALGEDNYDMGTYDLRGRLRDGGGGSGGSGRGGGYYNPMPLLLASQISHLRPAGPVAAPAATEGDFLGSGGAGAAPAPVMRSPAPAPAYIGPSISTLMMLSMMPMYSHGYGGSGEWDGD